MLKIAIIGVVASLLAIQLGEKKEYGTYISIICVVLVGYFVLDKLNVVITVINTLGKYIDIDISYIKLLLKMIGITYVAEFSAQICTDAGYDSISKQIEMAAKFTILAMSMPIILNVLDLVTEILK